MFGYLSLKIILVIICVRLLTQLQGGDIARFETNAGPGLRPILGQLTIFKIFSNKDTFVRNIRNQLVRLQLFNVYMQFIVCSWLESYQKTYLSGVNLIWIIFYLKGIVCTYVWAYLICSQLNNYLNLLKCSVITFLDLKHNWLD